MDVRLSGRFFVRYSVEDGETGLDNVSMLPDSAHVNELDNNGSSGFPLDEL